MYQSLSKRVGRDSASQTFSFMWITYDLPDTVESDWIKSSRGPKVISESCSVVSDSAAPWTIAHQAPLSLGILQARILEWVATLSSGIKPASPAFQADSLLSEPLGNPYMLLRESEKVKLLGCVRLFETRWTVAYQSPTPMGFSRQGYWGGLPFPSPGDLPHPGIEPGSPALQADTLTSEPPGKPMLLTIPQMLMLTVYTWRIRA